MSGENSTSPQLQPTTSGNLSSFGSSNLLSHQNSEILVAADAISTNAMSFPTLQGSFPNSQEQFLNNGFDIEKMEKPSTALDDSTSSISVSFGGNTTVSQSTSTTDTPNSAQPFISQNTIVKSNSKIFGPLPPTPPPQKSKSIYCTSNKFLRFCCNIRNALLAIFIAQSLFSIIATIGFLYYAGQSFLDQTTLNQYHQSFRTVQSSVEEFLKNVDMQADIVQRMVILNLIDITSRSDVIKVLGSLQSVNQAGYITIYIDLASDEVTGFDRLNNTYLLTFANTTNQLFMATYNTTTFEINPPFPHPFIDTYSPPLSSWYQRTIAEYNGSVMLHSPSISKFDSRIILSATMLVGHPFNSSAYIGMFAFRYDIDLLATLLQENTQRFSESTVLIVDSTCEIIAASTFASYTAFGSNNILRHTLKNATDPVIRNIASYFPSNDCRFKNALYTDIYGYYVSIDNFENDYSRDWSFIVITGKPQFSHVVTTTGSVLALIAAIIILISALIAITIFVNVITNQIAATANTLFKIAHLNIPLKTKKNLSVIYELRLLQEGVNSIKIGLSSFARYVPRALVQSLLISSDQQSTLQLGVQSQNMTILFCDIQDFTTKTEEMTSSVLLQYLSQYFSVIANLIERNNGVVDKFIGDAVLGFWNHPYGKIEQHELLACKTALECVTLIKQLSNRFAKEGLPEINIRIGINSGNVLVGNVGSENRYNYTVLGDVTNIASRLEALNKVFETEILIGEETYEKVKNEYLCYWVELVQLKGKTQSLNVYELINLKVKATLDEVEISNRLLQIRDLLDSNNFEGIKQTAQQLKKDFPEQSVRADYFYTKASNLQTRPPSVSLIEGRSTILKHPKNKSFVMENK